MKNIGGIIGVALAGVGAAIGFLGKEFFDGNVKLPEKKTKTEDIVDDTTEDKEETTKVDEKDVIVEDVKETEDKK